MAKNHKCKVTKAFVHEGKIRTPGAVLTLSETAAKPLLEAGKVVLAKGDDSESKAAAKPAAKADAKAADDTAKG